MSFTSHNIHYITPIIIPLTKKATKIMFTMTTMAAMTISAETNDYDEEEEGDVVTTKTMI